MIERLKAEQVADIFQVVKGLRLQNPEFVTSLASIGCIEKRCSKMCIYCRNTTNFATLRLQSF